MERRTVLMNSYDLKNVILDQEKIQIDPSSIKRDQFERIVGWHHDPIITIVSGIRRCGKSTLLFQIKGQYDGYYLNFDDERLIPFSVSDFQQLDEIFHELYGLKDTYYFDEIQNIQGWERFVRRMHDSGKKIYITGSNAHLLSKELGTHLTGRFIQSTLYPFSFKEFLKLNKIQFTQNDFYQTEGKANFKKAFNFYLINGGFPEYLRTKNAEYIKALYESLLYRDILVRYNISNEKVMRELMLFIFSNIGKQISYSKLKSILGVKSQTTIKEYFSYLENSYLVFLISKQSYSLKENVFANKKVYLIDNSIAYNLGYRYSNDTGRFLENLILVELKRRNEDIYYFSDKYECDFVLKEGTSIRQAIQVCYELNSDNRDREYHGLLEVLKYFDLKDGLIITYDQEEDVTVEEKNIKILPVWKWLLL